MILFDSTISAIGESRYGLLALAWERDGDEQELQKDALKHLYDLYHPISAEVEAEIKRLEENGEDASDLKENGQDQQARRFFKLMCDGDPQAKAL